MRVMRARMRSFLARHITGDKWTKALRFTPLTTTMVRLATRYDSAKRCSRQSNRTPPHTMGGPAPLYQVLGVQLWTASSRSERRVSCADCSGSNGVATSPEVHRSPISGPAVQHQQWGRELMG